ncbi:MAG TPA: hypothetical protein VFW70_10450 [Methylomirabilota bacterium]|nr:hypothetical protein [Methylomirabilota bacterium]
MAAWAASTPASSLKSASRVAVDQPEPFAPRASTMAVTNAVISADSSVCTWGMWVETSAMRSCRMVTSPLTIRPSLRSASSLPASAFSREEFRKVRSAPLTIIQPHSTSRSSEIFISSRS